MSADIALFSSRSLSIDPQVGQVVKVVGLRDDVDERSTIAVCTIAVPDAETGGKNP